MALPRDRSLARAAARPLNLAVLAVLAVIAVLTAPWLLALAIPIYGVLVAASYRPPNMQPAVSRSPSEPTELDGVSAQLRPRVRHALDEQGAILRALSALPVQPPGLAAQVEQLGRDLTAAARRASEVDDYLGGVDAGALRTRLAEQQGRSGKAAAALAEQVELVDRLTERRQQLGDELEHVDAVLGTIRARLLTAGLGVEEAGRLREEVDDLRADVGALTGGLSEVYEHRALPPGS
jgi:hypothetical protein